MMRLSEIVSFGAALILALLAFNNQAVAQPVECEDPQTQYWLNQCAYLDWQEADKELNAAWKKIREHMRREDSFYEGELKGAEAALLKSQRAWIDVRDGTCEAMGFQARGGSLEPYIVGTCLTDMTRQRIKQFGEIIGEER